MARDTNFFKWEMVVLQVLKQRDCYGYELAGILKDQTGGIIDIKMGTLYPILYKLVKAEYITSTEISIGKKTKVIYKLEPSGEELLSQLKERYLSWAKAIYLVMGGDEDVG